MSAIIALADGTVMRGQAIGKPGTAIGEVVFSTAMTGYQEALTDPSFAGQILTFTYPLIGNYGVTEDDFESGRVQVEGVVVREVCSTPSNWRSKGSLWDFLSEHGVVGIAGVDTRALTRHIRIAGVMLGGISTDLTADELIGLVRTSPEYDSIDFVNRVTSRSTYVVEGQPGGPGAGKHVAVVDFGVKRNIIRRLTALGCTAAVYPCTAPAEEILERNPHGVVLSPGPGDPRLLGYAQETVGKLIGKLPIMGICLGHQLVGRALGADIFKLKFGHRGSNHPVKELATGRVTITSQNHGYAVSADGLGASGAEVSHVNCNDGTVEGLRHEELRIITMQYHPEASPGPRDSDGMFAEFIAMI
jgi:carbamoyl-phosphate synthase small subunit